MYSKFYTTIIAALSIACTSLHAQNIFPSTGAAGIGTITPDASSLLEIKSTTKGLLIPRMTQTQRNAITSPATGLMIYQTNATPGFYYYGGGGWKSVAGKAWNLTGNSGTDSSINFIGTTDANPLVFRVNNVKSGYIDYSAQSLNTALGFKAMLVNSTGITNTSMGYTSLYSNTSGSYNAAFGVDALYFNTTGNFNTALGTFALTNNNTGTGNVGVGLNALVYNGTGNNNTAMGTNVLYNNTTGYDNTANGYEALYSNTMGYYNTANGAYAGYNNSTGTGNFLGGYYAGYNDNSSYNTMIGIEAGYYESVVNGSNNTYIGYYTGPTSSGFFNSAAIGSEATPTASYQMRFGDASVSSIGGTVGWSTLSDGRFKKNIHKDVHGLDFIKLLRPITYTLDIAALNKQTGADKKIGSLNAAAHSAESEGIAKQEKNIYTGFVAQEVEAAAKKVGYNFSGIDKPKNDKDIYGLRYSDFVVPLVKAVQELSAMNDAKEAKIDTLQNQLNELRTLVFSIQQQQQSCSPSSAAVNNAGATQSYAGITDGASLQQNIPNPFTNNTTNSPRNHCRQENF